MREESFSYGMQAVLLFQVPILVLVIVFNVFISPSSLSAVN